MGFTNVVEGNSQCQRKVTVLNKCAYLFIIMKWLLTVQKSEGMF